jgi:hypothetical protein
MKILPLLISLFLIVGCSFNVKTQNVANYSNLDRIEKNTTKNDVALLLGSPQGKGIYGPIQAPNELDFYFGFAGLFSMGGEIDIDSGIAFITYKENKAEDLIYFRSNFTGNPKVRNKNIRTKQVIDSIQLGKSTVDDIIKVIGQPEYKGRRANFSSDIVNKVAYWDSSEINPNGAIKEKWLLVGYDKNSIVQDVIWVSSKPEDIKEFGEVTEQQLQQMSRLVVAGFIPMLEPTGMNTGTKIDPTQVDALVKNRPKNIKDVISVLGLPSALGIKIFQGSNPLALSNWSFSSVEIKGRQTNYIPPEATEEQKSKVSEDTFIIMNIDQSRLMIGHTADGEIKEILWTKAIK